MPDPPAPPAPPPPPPPPPVLAVALCPADRGAGLRPLGPPPPAPPAPEYSGSAPAWAPAHHLHQHC